MGMRLVFKFCAAAFFFLFLPTEIFSHTLKLLGGADNFVYETSASNGIPVITDQTFFIGANISLRGDFSQNISYNFEFGRDTLWTAYLLGEALFRFSPMKVGIGAVFQYTENWQKSLFPAFQGVVGLEVPGGLFIEGKVLFSLDENLEKENNISYNYFSAAFGYWAEYVCALVYGEIKEYKTKADSTTVVKNSLTRLYLHIMTFQKNRGFSLALDAGYQIYASEITKTKTETDSTDTIFFAAEFNFQFSETFGWHLKGEMPVPLLGPKKDYVWLNIWTGFSFKLAD